MTDIRQIDAREHLARILESRGHGGAVATAIDLDTDTSTLAKWVRGIRPIPPHRVPRIMALTPTIRPGPAPDAPPQIREKTDMMQPDAPDPATGQTLDQTSGADQTPDQTPDHPSGTDPAPDQTADTAPDARPMPDMEDLEEAVLSAQPHDRFDPGLPRDDDRDGDAPGIPKMDMATFRAVAWMPAHQFYAARVGPPGDAVILGSARTADHACAAAWRCADRAGLLEIIDTGHWTADLAILGMYVVGLRNAVIGARA